MSVLDICAFFYMENLFGVGVFQRSIVNRGHVSPGYMCILLYVKDIQLLWYSRDLWLILKG